ncbi:MAG: MFS transporter [Gammaproteobacteria bacterium]
MTPIQEIDSPMTRPEKRATWSLAGIYALRMLGLFLIMPVLSLYAEQLDGATPALIGLAIGIYGIMQSILQIPFGLVSDRWGRKKVIVAGLLLFFAGSVVAALSTNIYGIIIGRAIQGSGAIAAAVMALVADLTQEVHRTKAMALIGASIGVSFGVAITAGPLIASYIGVHGIFWLISTFALAAILIILLLVPTPRKSKRHREAELIPNRFGDAVTNVELLRFNYGIFILHLVMTASFVVVPLLMRDAGLLPARHWMVYLPVFVLSLAVMIPFIVLAEKKQKMKGVFVGAIAVLILAFAGLMLFHAALPEIIALLLLFFCGFNLLEASLPSLVSKTAPGDLRGTAMGVYSTCQFMGAGIGGAAGGWCYGHYGASGVFLACAALVCSWLLLAFGMKAPRHWANLLLSLDPIDLHKLDDFERNMLEIAGVEEVALHPEEAVAYLKIDKRQLDTEALQTLIVHYSK